MASNAHAAEESHGSPLGPKQYIQITIGLGIITAVELAVSYAGLATAVFVPILIILSGVKFAVVVALFMHLRFESRLFTQMFLFGLVLASAILISLLAVFWNDPSDALGGGELPPLEGHGAAHQLFLGAPDQL
ncbi:MAG: cytochrome C oxidase subunit IV [Chloroflexi bacterium]|nr:cytochrome C oxidase subunit IV family protein [Chloroflexota bacterium]MDA1147309.1 cytochrome C oxidase subunit IV family protein [Chloroflexota bacterium]MQC82478.1 cytochrome C oxidase subunit IV [Chloroflexota bacterium]MQC83274.1 cytochrome C oxidase subunit IV [Chloroflexota bacterium]